MMNSAFLGRGGEDGRGLDKKREKHVDEPTDEYDPVLESPPELKKRRTGRPRNKRAPPPPPRPVLIAPRPGFQPEPVQEQEPALPPRQVDQGQNDDPEQGELVLYSDISDINQGALGHIEEAMTPTPLTEVTPIATQLVDMQTPLPRRLRGPLPVIEDHATQRIEINILCGEGEQAFELTIDNAVMNPNYPGSFINPRDVAAWMGDGDRVFDLQPSEIRTILTPRGRIRCTRFVVLSFTFPQLKLPLDHALVSVLPDDYPDPGVSLIIGQPWIQAQNLAARFQNLLYVPELSHTWDTEYLDQSRPWSTTVFPANDSLADEYQLDQAEYDG